MAQRRMWRYRLGIIFVLALIVVLIVVVVSFRNTLASQEASRWVAHTHETISTLDEILAYVEATESAQRGYVITGQPVYLQESTAVRPLIDADLGHLQVLVNDNPSQKRRLSNLRAAIDDKLRYVDNVVALRNQLGFAAAQQQVLSGRGKLAMDRVRVYAEEMKSHEIKLLSLRALASANQSRRTLLTLAIGSAVNFFLVGVIFVLVIRDQRRNRVLSAAMSGARDEAIHSAELRAQFLANMSHEIRTPMNAVIGMTGLLLSTELTPDQRDLAQTVRSSGDALLTIIDDVLDFSKIEAGKLSIEPHDFDLRTTIESVIELFSESAHGKGLEIGALFDHTIPENVRGDAGRIRQILTNLIGNAVKFTKSGEVIVHLNREETADETVCVRFAVTDTGIGISEDVQAGLFQPFTQADASTTRNFGGTGLGLAISRQLVELMGGRIGIDSALGKGSTFWFSIPLAAAETAQDSRFVQQGSLEGIRVLVVDDNETHRRLLRHNVAAWKMDADEAADGPVALEKLRTAAAAEWPFAVAIIDVAMPDMNGVTLSRLIRSEKSIARVPIIAVTGATSRLEAGLMRTLGIDTCLVKPIKQSVLYNAIVNAISGRTTTVQEDLKTKPSGPRPLREDVRILVAEDNRVNQKLAVRQLESLGYRADAVGNGVEAIEALGRIDYDLVLMDCQMPEMDGFEATREIRKRRERHIPIIALTANALAGDRERCIAAGMDDYLSKPVREPELAAALSRWIPERSDKSPLDPEIVAGLRSLSKGTEDFLREIADIYLEDAPSRIEAIRAAMRHNDAAGVAAAAHALKSSSGNIGATSLYGLAGEVETIGHAGKLDGVAEVMERLTAEYLRTADWLREHV